MLVVLRCGVGGFNFDGRVREKFTLLGGILTHETTAVCVHFVRGFIVLRPAYSLGVGSGVVG